jgi:hypothetical protein
MNLNYDCWETIVKYASLHTLLRLRLCNKDFEELTCKHIEQIKRNVLLMHESLDNIFDLLRYKSMTNIIYELDTKRYVGIDSIVFRVRCFHEPCEITGHIESPPLSTSKNEAWRWIGHMKTYQKYWSRIIIMNETHHIYNGTRVELEYYIDEEVI